MLTIRLDYDAEQQAIYVSYPALPEDRVYFLDTAEQVEEHAEALWSFWRANCGGERVHWVLNYDNFSVSPKAADPDEVLRGMRQFLDQVTLSVIRYGGGLLSRSLARWMDSELQGPLVLCDTREEADAALRRLRGPEFTPTTRALRDSSLNP